MPVKLGLGTTSNIAKGVFIANADTFLVIATYGTISSHFDALESASWLSTSYGMAMCASQPVVGKLSDIFGRKPVLLTCYALFAIGSLVCGAGQSMLQVIIGRSVAGIGGGGMVAIVSILITDLVPLIEIASWRSYVNVAATTGRSVGGPLGGWLADSIGWRWSFIGQAPITGLAFVLVLWKLEDPVKKAGNSLARKPKQPSNIGRVDFVGAILIVISILAFLFAVDIAGQNTRLTSPLLLGLAGLFLIFGTIFVIYEAKYAREPIFPPQLLLRRDVAIAYIINAAQGAAQSAMMFSVPLYFQVTEGASDARAGSHLVPAVVGNAVASLMAGIYIKKTGRYKKLILLALLCAVTGYSLMVIRWDGSMDSWESLYVIPGGFGTGMSMAGSFIALTANLEQADMAVATSGLYLAGNLGLVVGVSMSNGVQKAGLRRLLAERLTGPGSSKASLDLDLHFVKILLANVLKQIIKRILSDVSYVKELSGSIKRTVIGSYVESLEYSHGELLESHIPLQ